MKNQTSTEYLIILAIVIILGLIVLGVLGAFPSVGNNTGRTATDSFWKTQSIGIEGFALSMATNDSLIIRNNNAYSIQLTSIEVGYAIANITSINVSDILLGVGESKVISQDTISGVFSNFLDCSLDSEFKAYVRFNYTILSTQTSYSFMGERAYSGICSQ